MHKGIDMVGKRYGRLVVIALAESSVDRLLRWRYRCDCGNEKIAAGAYIRNGHVTSCGCYGKEQRLKSRLSHGKSYSRAYRIWLGMKTRCNRENGPSYKWYGARGIKVCARWADSFQLFLADMGDPPPNTSLDRIDFNGNYEPSNCRWATIKQQNRNTRSTNFITYKGITLSVIEWSEKTGISYPTLMNRVHAWGKDYEKIFERPVGCWPR